MFPSSLRLHLLLLSHFKLSPLSLSNLRECSGTALLFTLVIGVATASFLLSHGAFFSHADFWPVPRASPLWLLWTCLTNLTVGFDILACHGKEGKAAWLPGAQLQSVCQCDRAITQEIGCLIKEVICYFFWNDFVKIVTDFSKIVGWRLPLLKGLWEKVGLNKTVARGEEMLKCWICKGGAIYQLRHLVKVEHQIKDNYFMLLCVEIRAVPHLHKCDLTIMMVSVYMLPININF